MSFLFRVFAVLVFRAERGEGVFIEESRPFYRRWGRRKRGERLGRFPAAGCGPLVNARGPCEGAGRALERRRLKLGINIGAPVGS